MEGHENHIDIARRTLNMLQVKTRVRWMTSRVDAISGLPSLYLVVIVCRYRVEGDEGGWAGLMMARVTPTTHYQHWHRQQLVWVSVDKIAGDDAMDEMDSGGTDHKQAVCRPQTKD